MTATVLPRPPRTFPASAGKAWEEQWATNTAGRRLRLLVFPGTSRYRPYVAEAPVIATSSSGELLCSLRFFLQRQPTVTDGALDALVERAVCAFHLGLDLKAPAPYVPRYVSQARYTLRNKSSQLASVVASGAGALASMEVALDRDDALDLLRATTGSMSLLSITTEVKLEGEAPGPFRSKQTLSEVFLGSFPQSQCTSCILWLAPGPNGYEPMRRLMHAVRSRSVPSDRIPVILTRSKAFVPFASLASPRPAQGISAHALLQSDATHLAGTASDTSRISFTDRMDFLPILLPRLHLPLFTEPTAAVFNDSLDANSYWYLPTFALAQPRPADDPASSSFLFKLQRTGVTPGPPPRPSLAASVRFTLTSEMTSETKNALAQLNNPSVQAIPVEQLSVELKVPYMDGGLLKTEVFQADVQEQSDGTYTATINLLDDAVRMAYGSLAFPGTFQAQPAQVSVAYLYRAVVPIPGNAPHVVLGGKLALTPAALAVAAARASRNGPARIAVRPSLQTSATFLNPIRLPSRAVRTLVHAQDLNTTFPCANYGGFYLETTDQGDTAIGCTDAFKLGEFKLKLYEELAELRDTKYSVYRSLSQPGRFLVVPTTYRIARFGPADGDDKAYHPSIVLYSVLDSDESKNKFFFQASLQPDIPLDARIQLESALTAKTSGSPVVDYPTNLSDAAPASFSWVLPAGIDQPTAQILPDSISTGLTTNLDDALLILNVIQTTGINGSVSFALADGEVLHSSLVLDLDVSGPWATGPLQVDISPSQLTVTNKIERQVNLTTVTTRAEGAAPEVLPVYVTLAPGQSKDIALLHAATEAYCTCTVQPGPVKLQEMRIFIEDVTTNVIFINQVSLAEHDLILLKANARLKGTSDVHTLDDVSGPSTSLDLVLPLTTYLEAQTLEYQIVRVASDQSTSNTDWLQADLRKSNVVSITWDLIKP